MLETQRTTGPAPRQSVDRPGDWHEDDYAWGRQRTGNGQESISSLLKDAYTESTRLVRSELEVFKLELRDSARAAARDSLKVAVCGGAVLLGVLCLVAFMVIGLGALISSAWPQVNGYWISALAIGLLFTGVGGGLAYRFARRIGEDVKLDETRAELERDRRMIDAERRAFLEAVNP